MLLTRLQIINFRNIEKLECPIDLNLSLFLGENNVGKSNLLKAVNLGLGRNRKPFKREDFRQSSKPIVLRFYFEEKTYALWSKESHNLFKNLSYLTDEGLQTLCYQVTAQYKEGLIEEASSYLNLHEQSQNCTVEQLNLILNYRPALTINILRTGYSKPVNLQDHFKHFIEQNDTQVDTLPTEEELNDLWLTLLENRYFAHFTRNWPNLQHINDLNQWPIGNQVMAFIALYCQYIKEKMKAEQGFSCWPILVLEEPESNFYPLAVRAIGQFLTLMEGQKLITTHSAELLSKIPLRSLRKFYLAQPSPLLLNMGDSHLTRAERLKLEYTVQNQRGRLFFASTWLLVEGASEYLLFPYIATLMGYDFDLLGISCIEFSQTGLQPFVKAAQALRINYMLFTDNDEAGRRYRRTFKNATQNDGLAKMFHTGRIDIEHLFYTEGFAYCFEEILTASQLKELKYQHPQSSSIYIDSVISFAINKIGKPSMIMKLLTQLEHKGVDYIPKVLKRTVNNLYFRSTNLTLVKSN